MLEDNTKLKSVMSKLKDENGHFIITEDMPADIKKTLQFMNENGVDIYEGQSDEYDDNDEELLELEDDSDDDTEIVQNDEETNDFDNESIDVEELEDLF